MAAKRRASKASNKTRIAKKAEEAKATAADKKKKKKAATKKATKKKTTKKKTAASAKPTGRLKIVWAVCDHIRKVVKTYPYPEKADAEKEAARLTKSKGKEHVVRKEKVPME